MPDTTETPAAQQPPNYAATPIEQFQAALNYINTNLPTGMGMPLVNLLGGSVGIHIPPEALVPRDEAAADAAQQALADNLDKIADAIEGERAVPPKRRR